VAYTLCEFYPSHVQGSRAQLLQMLRTLSTGPASPLGRASSSANRFRRDGVVAKHNQITQLVVLDNRRLPSRKEQDFGSQWAFQTVLYLYLESMWEPHSSSQQLVS